MKCPECKEKVEKKDCFYNEHKRSIKQFGMCFNCCRWKLGHAGYGE